MSTKLVIPLATGIYTHEGLSLLLQGKPIDEAVSIATGNYWKEIRRRGIQIDPGEDAAYVADEQCALVEGMLRAYEKVQLPRLLDQYEIVETERDETWPMSEWTEDAGSDFPKDYILNWMARADALLKEKCSGDLYVVSYKTASQWDSRKSRENEHDMQGLSEVAAMEYRLHTYHPIAKQACYGPAGDAETIAAQLFCDQNMSPKLRDLLAELPNPPRIAGVKMEFLLKGSRYKSKTDGDRIIQQSPLIRGYQRMNAPTSGDPADLGWKREYTGEDGRSHRLDYRTWKAFNVWEQPGGVKDWIELLYQKIIQPEAGDVLDMQFVNPIPYFRNDDDMRDWYEQTVVQERRVAESVQIIKDAIAQYGWASPEVRSLMNIHFPQYRRSCDFPSQCSFVDICFGSNVTSDPVASGLYMIREPHHDPEKDKNY